MSIWRRKCIKTNCGCNKLSFLSFIEWTLAGLECIIHEMRGNSQLARKNGLSVKAYKALTRILEHS